MYTKGEKMGEIRTDLAIEAKELWDESAETTDKLSGVDAQEKILDGFTVTTVKILNEKGEKALGKPAGTYITLETDPYIKREKNSFESGCLVLSDIIKSVLNIDSSSSVMVVGLGNSDITPDTIGPEAVKYTMVTRHLVKYLPEHFKEMRQVAAFVPGVLADTGIESGELIKAAVDKSEIKAVIVVDALASRKLSRVCRTVQISDTGIIPGSGVGNARTAIDSKYLGVPVIAIGVPTVVDAGTLAYDLVTQTGNDAFRPEDFSLFGGDMIVTPRDIDKNAADMAKLLGYGINLALHSGITVEDITMFLD